MIKRRQEVKRTGCPSDVHVLLDGSFADPQPITEVEIQRGPPLQNVSGVGSREVHAPHHSIKLEVQLMVEMCRRVDLLIMDMDSREKELGGIAPWELEGHRVNAMLRRGFRGV